MPLSAGADTGGDNAGDGDVAGGRLGARGDGPDGGVWEV
jgi:hypothetical protein